MEAVLDAEEVALRVRKSDGKEAKVTAGSKEQVPGTVEKKKKVTDNELMLKLRERMKLAEKQEEERKKRKSQAQRRKESDRKKEDKKQAAGSMKVRSMLKLWSREEGGEKPSTSGSIPHKLDIVRKPPGTDQGSSLTGRRSPGTSQRSSLSGRNQEGGEKPATSGSIPHKLAIVRKPPGTDQGSCLTGTGSPGTSQGSSWSGRNQEATAADEGGRIKEGSMIKEQLTGSNVPLAIPGKICWNNGRNGRDDRKQEQEDAKEVRKPQAKPRGRKTGTSGSEEPKLTISALIKNYNSLETSARNKVDRNRSSEKLEKVVEKSTVGLKRKLEMVEEEMNLLGGSGNKRCRTPLTTLSTSERDRNKLKQVKINTLLFSKEPVTGGDRGEEQGCLVPGVGELLGKNSECGTESPVRNNKCTAVQLRHCQSAGR